MPDYIDPFIVGGPVPSEWFVGRRREVKTILDRLTHSARGSTAISGERLIGKTSLLHYISDPKVAAEWGLQAGKCNFILTDSQTIAPFTPLGFWQYVLKSLAAREICDTQYINNLIVKKKVNSFEFGRLFDRIAEDGKLVVLLLDEFEYIVKSIDPKNPEFLDVLRSMANRKIRGLALITASREPLHVLCRDIYFKGSPFPTGFASVSLGPFSLEEANKLIDVYTQGTGVTFSEKDREFAYEISKGHPYLLQKACFKLFQRHVEKMTQRR